MHCRAPLLYSLQERVQTWLIALAVVTGLLGAKISGTIALHNIFNMEENSFP